MQLYREKKETPILNIHNLKKKKKHNKRSLYIVLIEEILLLKTAWVHLGTYKDNMALLQSIWGKSILVFIPFPLSPPSEDILIVNAPEQRAKHS